MREPDGLIICRQLIEAVGPYEKLRASLLAGTQVADYSGCILSAGLHRHSCALCAHRDDRVSGQADVGLAQRLYLSGRGSLRRRGPRRFVASAFCGELIGNGTTPACGLSTGATCGSSPANAMMDHNVPEALRDTAQSGDQSKALIAKWHLLYAITPRWAG
jgi:guanine deaminase